MPALAFIVNHRKIYPSGDNFMAGRTEPTVRGAYLLIAFFADDLWGFMEHPSALRRPLLIVVPAALEVFRACLLPSPLFDVLPMFGFPAAVKLFLSHGWFPLLVTIRADCFHYFLLISKIFCTVYRFINGVNKTNSRRSVAIWRR